MRELQPFLLPQHNTPCNAVTLLPSSHRPAHSQTGLSGIVIFYTAAGRS